MGKGYNNFMCKKPFHPGSRDNLKRVWCAQQKTEEYNQKEEEMRQQYEKEQDLYNNRLLVSTESKEKLSLNFMYEAPVGAQKERVREDDEPEYKFEWQRHAPRESFAKGDMDIRDQPFGIQVRNVRCLKCHKWGHVNTDRECSMYSQTSVVQPEAAKPNPEELVKAMQEDGLAFKKSLIGQAFDPRQANQMMIPKEEDDPEMAYLRTLSKKQKKKLLRKLDKLSNAHNGSKDDKSKKGEKKKKDKKKSKKSHKRSRSSSVSESSSNEDDHPAMKRKRHDSVDRDSHPQRRRSRSPKREKDSSRHQSRSPKREKDSSDHRSKSPKKEKDSSRHRSRSPKREKDSSGHRSKSPKKEKDASRHRSRSPKRDQDFSRNRSRSPKRERESNDYQDSHRDRDSRRERDSHRHRPRSRSRSTERHGRSSRH